MKPLNVLLINHVSRIGGAERSLLDLLPALKHEGISPTVAAPEGELLSRVRELNIPTRPLDIGRHRRPGSLPQLLKALYQLRKASAQIRSISELRPPDILHAVSLTAALPTAWAAEAIHRPSLWHCRDLRYPKQVLRMLARTPTRAIAISSTVAESLNSCRMRLQVQTCLNAIDTSRFNLPRSNRAALRAQFGLPTDGCLLLIAAHFVPWKRHDLALEATAPNSTCTPTPATWWR